MIHGQATKTSQIIDSVTMTNTETASGTLDLLGADYAVISINFSAELNTNGVGPTIALEESDDLTTYATFDGDFARSAETLVSAKQVRYDIDAKTRKRYLKLSITTATTTNDNITVGAIGVLGRLGEEPSNTTDMVATGDVAVIG